MLYILCVLYGILCYRVFIIIIIIFYLRINYIVPKFSDQLIKDVKANEAPGSLWWEPLNMTNSASNVNFPSLHWSGWYDIFCEGTLTYMLSRSHTHAYMYIYIYWSTRSPIPAV